MDIKNGNEKLINNKPKLLLHSCCGPCSTSVIERLVENYDITVFYFNPNIFPYEEYLKRLNEQKRLLKILNIPFIEGEYNQEIFNNALIGCENQKEGELRCFKCYELRLKHTFEKALELNFDYYTTTLTVSPRKNAVWVNHIGSNMQSDKLKFLSADFKKKDGYKRSIELSKVYNLYRQHYCGCKNSLPLKD